MKKNGEIKVCLVGSSGGHLTHLYMLKPFWKDKNRFWVTFDKEDARSLLEGEKVYPCYFPTNRSIKALIKNTKIAWDVLHKEKPDLIISCGAAVAVPFFYIGKMMGAKLVYIEVFDRIDKPTMTGKMVYMSKNGCRIGGEQSGHIIFSKYASTGDGILTSLKMMEVMLAKKKPMSELAAPLKIYPQVLENVRVTDKKAAQNDPVVQEAVKKVAEALGDTGRILVRESGTEPVIRVMVEAPDHDICQKYVDEVVNVICEKGYKV